MIEICHKKCYAMSDKSKKNKVTIYMKEPTGSFLSDYSLLKRDIRKE